MRWPTARGRKGQNATQYHIYSPSQSWHVPFFMLGIKAGDSSKLNKQIQKVGQAIGTTLTPWNRFCKTGLLVHHKPIKNMYIHVYGAEHFQLQTNLFTYEGISLSYPQTVQFIHPMFTV